MGSLINFVKDGVIKLPPGFRFQPTDEEIVFQYLLRKTFSCPLPASIIPEINICKHNPWDLPGEEEQDRYFFSNKESNKYPNGNQTKRATQEGGYWKATGVDKEIVCSKRKPLVGLRKTLVFYVGKPQRGTSRTDWIMHEYRIILTGKAAASCSQLTTTTSCHQRSSIQLGNWVLCHIFLKKGSASRVHKIVQDCKNNSIFAERSVKLNQPILFDTSEIGSTSSSDSSVVTDEVCSSSSDDDTSSHIDV